MTQNSLVNTLAQEIRQLYTDEPGLAAQRIERLLKQRLAELSPQMARETLTQIADRFRDPSGADEALENRVMTRVFSLLLGRKVEPDDLTSSELLERLAESLNTIFDMLNQLISVINMSFSQVDSRDQTIRQFIGFHLEGDDQTQSLEAYIGQINQAFLTTHEAFKKAVQRKIRLILNDIDPHGIEDATRTGLRIGPLRKAEYYDILKEKIERIQKWFDSGRFMEDFLREFEKNCQSFNRK